MSPGDPGHESASYKMEILMTISFDEEPELCPWGISSWIVVMMAIVVDGEVSRGEQ
jgi:hypothetical protein